MDDKLKYCPIFNSAHIQPDDGQAVVIWAGPENSPIAATFVAGHTRSHGLGVHHWRTMNCLPIFEHKFWSPREV